MEKVTLIVETKNKYSGLITTHDLHIRVHKDVVKNKTRLSSHCNIVAKKNYGTSAIVKSIELNEV